MIRNPSKFTTLKLFDDDLSMALDEVVSENALLGVFLLRKTRLLQKDTIINKLDKFVILLYPL